MRAVFEANWTNEGGLRRLNLCWNTPPGQEGFVQLTWREAQLVRDALNAHPVLGHEWAFNASATDPDPPPGTIPPPHAPNGPQRPPTASTIHQSAILQGFRHALSIVARRRAMESHPWGLAVLADAELMLMAELKVLENPLGPSVIGDPRDQSS